MLPESLLASSFRGETLRPRFLDGEDRPWLESLLAEHHGLTAHEHRLLLAELLLDQAAWGARDGSTPPLSPTWVLSLTSTLLHATAADNPLRGLLNGMAETADFACDFADTR